MKIQKERIRLEYFQEATAKHSEEMPRGCGYVYSVPGIRNIQDILLCTTQNAKWSSRCMTFP